MRALGSSLAFLDAARRVLAVCAAGYICLLAISCMQMTISIMTSVICLLYTEPYVPQSLAPPSFAAAL